MKIQKTKIFSLVEMLIMISILAILVTLLSPTLKKMLTKTRIIQCGMNQKDIYQLAMMYTEDYNNNLPANSVSDDPRADFVRNSLTNPGGLYPSNISFPVMLMGYQKGLPTIQWATSLGNSKEPPNPMFLCPEGEPTAIYAPTFAEEVASDKRFVNYNNFRYVWAYVNDRDEKFSFINGSIPGVFMQLPLTDIRYSDQTIFFVDSRSYHDLNQSNSNKPLVRNQRNQLEWLNSGVRVEHDGQYQMVLFSGAIQLMSYPDVHPSLTYSWLQKH